MSLKMGIEAAIHIDHLDLKELNKTGWVYLRLSISYRPQHSSQPIYFTPSNIDNTLRPVNQRNNEPEMCSDYSQSQKYEVSYHNDPIRDGTTYYFKVYIDLQLLPTANICLNVDLLFAESFKSNGKLLHNFQAHIKHSSNLLEYLPITFDQYGSLTISGTYHSALMEYKFEKNEDQSQFLEQQYPSLLRYFAAKTLNYRHNELMNFYHQYRQRLQSQLSSIQERCNELSKMMLNHTKQSAYSKMSQNRKLLRIIQRLKSSPEIQEEDQARFCEAFLEDVLNFKALIYPNWNELNGLIKNNSRKIVSILKERYEDQIKEGLKANIFSQRIKHHDWTFNKYGQNCRDHLEQVSLMRKGNQSNQQDWGSAFAIQDLNFFPNFQHSLKIFEEIYETGNHQSSQQIPQGHQHVIFMVHGYQAHRNDFIEFKLSLEARLKARVYISCANIDKTDDSIQKAGIRLAIEVKKYLQTIKLPYKVSFIGHSMGGIIVRSAMEHLKFLQNQLHAYVSLCTPHLGYLYQSSTLVQAGLWFLNAFEKCDSMLQLTMQDQERLRDTFLYKLSGKGGLNKFKKLAFVCSSQDQYVSFSSARAQKNSFIFEKLLKDKPQRQIICQMVDNMLCEVQASQISRIDVIFNIQSSNFDSFIGRTGHVKFLCDPHFLKLFTIGLDHLLN